MKINFKNNGYSVKRNNIAYVLSYIEKKNLSNATDSELLKLMKKYKLFNEDFLDTISEF